MSRVLSVTNRPLVIRGTLVSTLQALSFSLSRRTAAARQLEGSWNQRLISKDGAA